MKTMFSSFLEILQLVKLYHVPKMNLLNLQEYDLFS